MKDKATLQWLYHNSRTQLTPMIILILGNALIAVCGVAFALVSRGVIDGAVSRDRQALIFFALILLGVILLQLLLNLLCRHLEEIIKARLEMKFKSQLYSKLLRKDYPAVSAYHSGELLNHLTSDVTIISNDVATIVPHLALLCTRLVGAFTVLVALDPLFALVFAVGGSLVFIVAQSFRGLMKQLHKNVQETDGKVRSFLQESLENLLVVKVFGVQKQMEERAARLQQDNYQAKRKRMTISILANSGFGFIFQLGYLFALIWGAYKLYLQSFSFGTLTAILQLVGQIQTPFVGLSGLLPKYYAMLASAERIMELERLDDETELNAADMDTSSLEQNFRAVVCTNISFKYDRDSILENASLYINKGDFMLLSGISGIGKSTLIKLLLGVYKPDKGKIYLQTHDNQRVNIDQHSRKLFSYVPQGNLLLSGTIKENISFIRPTASDDEIMRAARISCAEEFINQLSSGLNTVIREKGHGLSEGQIQRLAIARAVLSDTPILILDEATSALDEGTEQRLLRNIKAIPGKTCLIISHRKAALAICNIEVIIENRSIISRGEGSSNDHSSG